MPRFTISLLAVALLAAPAHAERIKLSYAGVNANFAQYFAAEDKGYFKEEGLDVTLTQAGGGVAIPALLAGDLDYSGSPSSAMSAILRGAPLKIILIGQSKPIYELWSFDPAAHRLEDLKGKMVAITIRGGTDELGLRILLANRKLPGNFLAITPAGSDANILAALLSGSQQNAVITRTQKGQLKASGALERGRMLADFHDEVVMQTGGIVTSAKELSEHRDRAKRLLRAVWKGTLYLMTQREGVIDLLKRRLPGVAETVLAADVEGGMADVEASGTMPLDAAAKELALRAEINNVPADKVPPPASVYDFSLIREAQAEIKRSGWQPAR